MRARIASLVVVLAVCAVPVGSAAEADSAEMEGTDVRSRFEELYDAYKQAPEPSTLSSLSYSPEQYRYLHKMSELGPAVTPYLMEKLRETRDINLVAPVAQVTRKRFETSAWPGGEKKGARALVDMYIDWWDSKVGDVRSEFDEAYARWQEAKAADSWPLLRTKRYVYDSENQRVREKEELTEAGKALHSMEMMGVVALPYVMEHLREGDHDLLVLAERLSDDAVRAGGPPPVRARKYLAWWRENERKWNIPAARRRVQGKKDEETAG